MHWTLFSDIATQLDGPVQGFVNATIAALSAYLVPVMRAAIVLYIAGMAAVMAIKPNGHPFNDTFANIIRAGLVFFIISSAANFNQYFGTVFLQTLPTELTNAIAGSTGSHPLAGAAFDQVWNRAFAAGLVVYKDLPWSAKGLGLAIFVAVIYWPVSILAIGVAFLIYLSCHIVLALVVALGPIFVCCFLFPATRGMFSGWVAAMVGCVITQVLTVALLSLMLQCEMVTISRIAAADPGANPIGQFGDLLGGVLLFVICALLASQLPGIATGIAGGVHFHTQAITRATYGRAAQIGSNVLGAGAQVIASSPARAREALAASPASVQSPGRSVSSAGKAVV